MKRDITLDDISIRTELHPGDIGYAIYMHGDRWASMESIHKFAGEDAEVAVVAPAARPLFREYGSMVKHFDVVVNTQ